MNPFVVFLSDEQAYQYARLRALSRLSMPWMSFLATETLIKPLLSGNGAHRNVDSIADADGTGPRRRARRHIEKLLDDLRPCAVLVIGYASRVMRSVAWWAKRNRVPCIMATDTTAREKTRYLPIELLKGWWCRYFYDALLLPGERSVTYYASLGYPEQRIWRGASVVDNEHFRTKTADFRRTDANNGSNLDPPPGYFLTVCRLVPEKGLPHLIDAYCRYRRQGGDKDLVVVGDGPQRSELERQARANNLNTIYFAGWTGYEDLPRYYARASVFMLPSLSEAWGLVVNEALASGLPVLVSRNCGCSPELCRRGLNGYDFDPNNPQELARLMLKMSSDRVNLEAMGEASGRIIDVYRPDLWAISVADMLEVVLSSHLH
jgi:glycosyltransferase involved in cell wall biosynthesis